MTNGLVFLSLPVFYPLLCMHQLAFLHARVIGYPNHPNGKKMALSASEVETAPHLPGKLSHPLGALFGCTDSIRQIQSMGHEMTRNQCGCGETLSYRVPDMCLPSGGLRLGILSPGRFCICFLLPLPQL